MTRRQPGQPKARASFRERANRRLSSVLQNLQHLTSHSKGSEVHSSRVKRPKRQAYH